MRRRTGKSGLPAAALLAGGLHDHRPRGWESAYRRLIREAIDASPYDPGLIEGLMRVEHRTLDALSRADFMREARECARALDYASPEERKRLAESFGGTS